MIEVAIIAAGSRELSNLLDALDALRAKARVIAVAAADAKALEEIAGRFDVPPEARFADWQELLARTRVDLAVVGAPPDLRAEIITACAEACVHIATPAPIALDEESARRVRECLARNIVRMTVFPQDNAKAPQATYHSSLAVFIEYLETGLTGSATGSDGIPAGE